MINRKFVSWFSKSYKIESHYSKNIVSSPNDK